MIYYFLFSFIFLFLIILVFIIFLYKEKFVKNFIKNINYNISNKYFFVEFNLEEGRVYFKNINKNIIEYQTSIKNFYKNSKNLYLLNDKIYKKFLNETLIEDFNLTKINLILKKIKNQKNTILYHDKTSNEIFIMEANFQNEIINNNIIANFEGIKMENIEKNFNYFKDFSFCKSEENFISEVNDTIKKKNISNGLFLFLENNFISLNYDNYLFNELINFLFMSFLKEKYDNVFLTNQRDILILVNEKQKGDINLLKIYWKEIIDKNLSDFFNNLINLNLDLNYYNINLFFKEKRNNDFKEINEKYNLLILFKEKINKEKTLDDIYNNFNINLNELKNIQTDINNFWITKNKYKKMFHDWIFFYENYDLINNMFFISKFKRDIFLVDFLNKNLTNFINSMKKNQELIFPLFTIDYFFSNKERTHFLKELKIIFEIKNIPNKQIKKYFYLNKNIILKNSLRLYIDINQDVNLILEKLKPIEIYVENKYKSDVNLTIKQEKKIIEIESYSKKEKAKVFWIN